MVESNADPLVVTARIRRETRDADEERAREAAQSAVPPVASPPPAQGSLVVAPPPARTAGDPPDAETAYRHARLGVVAVLVLVLFWTWLRQRRAARQ